MLLQCTFLVTSRPSMNPHLNNIPHDEIALKGCKSDDFFETLLHNDVEGKKRIFYLLDLKPELRAICELPLNAVILIFIHKMLSQDDMPVTRTDLFSLMLSNFFHRHIHEGVMIKNLEEDLPPEIYEKLFRNCLLAYNSIFANKTVMSLYELKKLEKPDETLGLLRITRSVTVFGQDTHYSFPHLSIQEFLAALHIREASAIQKLMDDDSLNPVITFYAGLTKLKNKKVRDILMAVQNIPQDPLRLFRNTNMHGISTDDGWKHLAILNSNNSASLYFNLLPLYPSDFLSLAYYVRIKLRSISWLHITLGLCSITDAGLEAFSNEMSKGINKVTRGKLHLNLTGNLIITDRANRSITTLLSSGKITNFELNASMFPGTVSTTLKCIINGFNYSSLEYLSLIGSHINVTHVHYLILLVRKSSNLDIYTYRIMILTRPFLFLARH